MPDWSVDEQRTARGPSHFAEFVASLADPKDVKDVAVLAGALRALGNQLREPRSKSLDDGLFETPGHESADILRLPARTARGPGWRLREETDRHAGRRASADTREVEGGSR